MTVESSIQDVTYETDGVTLDYAVPFYFLDNAHVYADFIDSAESIDSLVEGTDYSLTGAGDEDGGTLTLSSTKAAGFKFHIYRIVPVTQETAYQQNSAFPARATETALDKLTMIALQIAAAVVNSIRYPLNEYGTDGTLPKASARVNTVLGFDDQGGQTLLPMPATVGAGDLKNEDWTAGTDFVKNTSTSVTLSRAYGTKANLGVVVMDGIGQDPDTYSLAGAGMTLQFDAPIPADRVWLVGGTTLSVSTPAAGSVGDAELQWGNSLSRVCGSVAELAALDPTVYTRASLSGYYAAGDGGGGGDFFYSVLFDPADANGGTIIAANNGSGCWVMTNSHIVMLEQFGTKGDGVTDDAARVQAAFDACIGVSELRGSLGKNYAIGTTLTVGNGSNSAPSTKNGFVFWGAAAGSPSAETVAPGAPVKFTWIGVSGGTMMIVNGPIYGVRMGGFTLDCASLASNGLLVNHPINSRFEEILNINYKGIGFTHLAYTNPTGVVTGSQHNVFCGVHSKAPAAGGCGAVIGAAAASGVMLDVAQNVYMNCDWWRDGTSSTSYSICLRFADVNSFIQCQTIPQGGSLGVGLFVLPPTGALNFPDANTFYNCPIQGGVATGTGWVPVKGIGFYPYPTGDSEAVPSTGTLGQYHGITDAGEHFGGLPIGAGNARIAAVLSNTASLTFGAIGASSASSQTISVPGAKVGDNVTVSSTTAAPAGFTLTGAVVTAGFVTVYWTNSSSVGGTPGTGTYRATVMQF